MKKKVIAAIGFCGLMLSSSVSGMARFDVENGMTGMGRDVVLQLLRIIRTDEYKVRTIIGMSAVHNIWRRHKYFLKSRYIAPDMALRNIIGLQIDKKWPSYSLIENIQDARETLEAGPGSTKEIKKSNILATMERIGGGCCWARWPYSTFLAGGFATPCALLETNVLLRLSLPVMSPADATALLRNLANYACFENPLRIVAIKRLIKERVVSCYTAVYGLIFPIKHLIPDARLRMLEFLGLIFSSKGGIAECNKTAFLVEIDEAINFQMNGKSPSDLIAAEKYIEEQMKRNKKSGTAIEVQNYLYGVLELKFLANEMINSQPKI